MSVFYQVWDDPLQTLAGEQFVGHVIRLCGGRNIFADAVSLAPKVGIESVLKRDPDGQYWLETPVERGRIDVDDAPFTAVELDAIGQGPGRRLIFRTNLDETVTAGPENPLRVAFDESTGEPSPYIHVRDGLEALLTRPVYYQLAELAEPESGTGPLGVWSYGMFFGLEPREESGAEPGGS